MKLKPRKTYKRKLSRAALDAMSRGGKKATVEQKSEAGKAGWQGLVKALRGSK